MSDDLFGALEYFWHPVATLSELQLSGGVMATRLLGRDLAIAHLGVDPDGRATIGAWVDRCPHRSTRLSVGCVDGHTLRCAYHGWRWASDGRCVEIPSAPGRPVPDRFRQEAFEAVVEHDLVWVRLRRGAHTRVPPLPAAADPSMRLTPGAPYVWPTGATRRVENFVDLAHFAWVHDGTLGDRGHPVPPEVSVRRVAGELRFSFVPPPIAPSGQAALFGDSYYRMPMPLTVNIDFAIAGAPGVRRHLWMTAAPVERGVCRSYWVIARNDGHDLPDEDFLDFQRLVLDEDEPVVCNQVPAEIPLRAGEELHVRADRVSIEYRRWLEELVTAAGAGVEALDVALGSAAPGATPQEEAVCAT